MKLIYVVVYWDIVVVIHGCFGVRPVVSLKYDVTTDVIPKIEDQEEQDWSKFSGGGFLPE